MVNALIKSAMAGCFLSYIYLLTLAIPKLQNEESYIVGFDFELFIVIIPIVFILFHIIFDLFLRKLINNAAGNLLLGIIVSFVMTKIAIMTDITWSIFEMNQKILLYPINAVCFGLVYSIVLPFLIQN